MAKKTMDPVEMVRKTLEEGSPDVVRSMVQALAEAMMSAEADGLCGAGYGERSPSRTNHRNGYRERRWDTRVGTIDLAIPKLRRGSYYPDWLLEPRRRSEKALVAVIAEAYLKGVSTRKVEAVVQQMGIEGISKSQVSDLCVVLDEQVEALRSRPLEADAYPYVYFDATYVKSREDGRIVNVAVVLAVGVTAQGYREILGIDVVTNETGASWTAFLRGLVARGLSCVHLVISDAHEGLKGAVASAPPGASWQRCRTHFLRNLLTRVPKSAQNLVATLVRTIFQQPDADQVLAQHGRVIEQLEESAFPTQPTCSQTLAPTSWPSPPSRLRTGRRSGATIRSSASTRRSSDAPTSSASSRTAPPCCASSVPCSPSSTTSEPSAAAT